MKSEWSWSRLGLQQFQTYTNSSLHEEACNTQIGACYWDPPDLVAAEIALPASS